MADIAALERGLPHRLPPRQRQLGLRTNGTRGHRALPRAPCSAPELARPHPRRHGAARRQHALPTGSTNRSRPPPDTRTILVIHGFRGDHHGLLRVADQLPDMRLIMPDLPGFGQLRPLRRTPAHSVERYGRFISGLHGRPGPGPGHRAAGPLLRLHRRQPFRGRPTRAVVRQLILVNPIAAPALEGPKGVMTKLAVLYYQAVRPPPPPARPRPAAQPAHRPGDE